MNTSLLMEQQQNVKDTKINQCSSGIADNTQMIQVAIMKSAAIPYVHSFPRAAWR